MSEPVQTTIKNSHRMGGLNSQHLFLMVQEARKFKIKIPTDLVSGENLIPGSQMAVLAVFSHGRKRERELSGVPFIRAPISFMRTLPL